MDLPGYCYSFSTMLVQRAPVGTMLALGSPTAPASTGD